MVILGLCRVAVDKSSVTQDVLDELGTDAAHVLRLGESYTGGRDRGGPGSRRAAGRAVRRTTLAITRPAQAKMRPAGALRSS
jgi:hypothetical protein